VLLRYFVVAAVLNVVLGDLGAVAGVGAFGPAAGYASALAVTGALFIRHHARMAERSLWSRFSGFWLVSLTATATGAGLAVAAARLPAPTVAALSAASCVLLVLPGWQLAKLFLRRHN
jgi:hypothetical protein